MPRLDRLPQLNRNNILMLPVPIHDTAPFTAPAKPLSFCRLLRRVRDRRLRRPKVEGRRVRRRTVTGPRRGLSG